MFIFEVFVSGCWTRLKAEDGIWMFKSIQVQVFKLVLTESWNFEQTLKGRLME